MIPNTYSSVTPYGFDKYFCKQKNIFNEIELLPLIVASRNKLYKSNIINKFYQT